ncbi:nuclear protein MDM1 isoform X1 [Psammomys obesus]|uniref:nuclear protein MDM1 isoform X1 n=1 Tax=Psammomys obesus TaxID=48139 RepID=UPI002452F472|nr:nuclear protein MDM1 isoform X1 [Psammomys obesus]
MPVRFKGLTEYQRNFLWKKSYLSESYNPSVAQKYSWAGLRSDQLGITKEPSFISKRRVYYHDPQISKSLAWNGAITENGMVVPPEPKTLQTPKPQEAEQKEGANQGVLSVEASRVPKRTRSHSTDSRAEGASDGMEKHQDVTGNHALANEAVEQAPSTQPLSQSIDPRLDRHLRKKAGLTVDPSHNALRNSEYQRQFVWKTCRETAPVFAANQAFRNKSQVIPQVRGNTVIPETEYKRNFKGLSPSKELKLREHSGRLETPAPEKKADEALELEVEMASEDSDQPQKPVPWRHQRLGKVNSEYRAKFLSPAQYYYKAGAWMRVKENMPNQDSLSAMWYAEVKELREKAESYRKRVQGTHFSRDHLNQILSDSNSCWDASSTTSSEGTISGNIQALDLAGDLPSHKTPQKHPPTKREEKEVASGDHLPKNSTRKLDLPEAATMPVRRNLAWGADSTKEDTQQQPRWEEDREERRGKDKQTCVRELETLDTQERSKADGMKEGLESFSLSSGKGGRLPTPQLRELGIQRTHHDLTTPAVGGAVLVSPSKAKLSSPEQRKRAPSPDGLETLKRGNHCAVGLVTSPAAGIKTVDPLPLREDCEADGLRFAEATPPALKTPDHQTNTSGQPVQCTLPHWYPSRRIQGCLRDPEFQHNLRKPRMGSWQFPQYEVVNNKDVDRLSDISTRSAASGLRAFQTLARAQKRKENFWGKT